MPVDPSRSCTPVGVLDAGGTALGTWPWGLASWHQQRAATATRCRQQCQECMLL